MLTVGSLFAGGGFLEYGLEMTGGFKTVFQVEIDDYATRVLERHWPDVKRYRDICDVRDVERVDMLCGGFPCPDISWAGPGGGLAGERSGLWREYFRLIRDLRPRYALIENVAALLERGLDRILCDLASIGFDAEWSVVSACSLGATHMRRRLFIVAYPNSFDGRPRMGHSEAQGIWSVPAVDSFADTRADQKARLADPSELYGNADGLAFGMDRNRVIGNGVFWPCSRWIGNRILEREAMTAPQRGRTGR